MIPRAVRMARRQSSSALDRGEDGCARSCAAQRSFWLPLEPRGERTCHPRERYSMAELTNLESKLGEVIGLALAAQAATKKVGTLARAEKKSGLAETLAKM